MVTRRYPSVAERDRAQRERCRTRVAATAIDPGHPAVLLAERFVVVQASVETAEAYSRAIARYFAWCAESGIDPFTESELDARAFMTAEAARGFAPATVGLSHAALRAFFRTALDEGVVTKSPFAKVKKPDSDPVTETPAINYEQADRLAQVCLEALGDPSVIRQRNGAFVYLMFRTGPRSIEVAAGRFGNLTRTPEGMTWQIRGKGARWSPLPLPPDVADVLDRWRKLLEAAIGRPVLAGDALVPCVGTPRELAAAADRGALRPLGASPISGIYADFLAEIGVEGPRFAGHSARATAASLGYGATKDLLAVQRMLRHKTAYMTQKYVRNLAVPNAAAAWTPRIRRGGEVDAA